MFAPLGPTYDRYASLLSYGQDPRWRRFLVSRIDAGPGDRVLDVATGTGAVARELAGRRAAPSSASTRAPRCSPRRRAEPAGEIELVEASAAEPAVRRRRVRRPDLHLPAPLRRRPARRPARAGTGRPPWRHDRRARVRAADAAPGAASGSCTSAPACPRRVRRSAAAGARPARSSAPRSAATTRRWPLDRQLEAWRDAGIGGVSARRLSLGGGVVTWGRKR